MFVMMNKSDIELFAKLYIYGTTDMETEQTSREPIELVSHKKHNKDGLFERFNMTECSLEEIHADFIQKLTEFTDKVNDIRSADFKYSKEQLAELKRQRKLVKQLKQTL